jgi:DNA-binding transcriptional MerR regulator
MYNLLAELSNPTIHGNLLQAKETLRQIILVIEGLFFGIDCKPFKNFCLVTITLSENGYTFFWESQSSRSNCPRCGTESSRKRGTSKQRIVIGEEILGKPVMHTLKEVQFICEPCKSQGKAKSFVEDISDICGWQRKTTKQLDEKVVNDAIYRSANGLAKDYFGKINIGRGTILNRIKEAGALVTENNLTDTDHVKILSVDDNNGRKGNSSTASTVIIDAENHMILAVAEGANSEKAEQLFKRFTKAQGLSRDRAGAYTKAGDTCNLEQYADIFHLVKNAHEAVKDVLSKELPYNIYVREGDGWIELPARGVPTMGTGTVEDTVFVTTLSVEDINLRIKLAQLSEKQEKKYRTTIELLQLHDQGLSTKEIRKRLDMTQAKQLALLRDAADVINGVEEKIDRYQEDMSRTLQKSKSKTSSSSSKSIVSPYADTVMRMVQEGHTSQTIYPVIMEMGFTGAQNTLYQYILKRRNEELVCEIQELTEDMSADSGIQRPLRVSMQRTTKTNVYKFVLHEVSEERKKQNGCTFETVPVTMELPDDTASAEKPPQKKQKSFYSEEIENIIVGIEREEREKKENNRFQRNGEK